MRHHDVLHFQFSSSSHHHRSPLSTLLLNKYSHTHSLQAVLSTSDGIVVSTAVVYALFFFFLGFQRYQFQLINNQMRQSTRNGRESQPLMMRGSSSQTSEMMFAQEFKRQSRSQSMYLILSICTVAIMLVLAISVIVMAVPNSLRVRHENHGSKNEVTSPSAQKYSTKAEENLQALFNGNMKINAQAGCQATILIMPPCESDIIRTKNRKDHENRCNWLGMQRSYFLLTLFGKERRWPVPYDIFVLGAKYKRNRAIESILPLQEYYHVQNRMVPKSYSRRTSLVATIAEYITSGELCEKIVTVTATFDSEIPKLALDLGCGPLNSGDGCPMAYENDETDVVWELKFVYDDDDGGHNQTAKTALTNNSKDNGDSKGLKWRVYGNTVAMNFDPLAFGKKTGEFGNDLEIREFPRWMNMSIYEDFP